MNIGRKIELFKLLILNIETGAFCIVTYSYYFIYRIIQRELAKKSFSMQFNETKIDKTQLRDY